MRFAYIRVSTSEQNESRQVEALKKYDISEENIFVDKTSGKTLDRKQYNDLKFKLREGDEVYIYELDRLGRSKTLILEELKWFKENKIYIRILDIPTTLTNFNEYGSLQSSVLETINNILIEVLSTLAEAEFIKNKKRQKEGIEIAKKQGKYKKCGRPKKEVPGNFKSLYEQYLKKNISMKDFQKILGYKNRKSVYDLINKYLKENNYKIY